MKRVLLGFSMVLLAALTAACGSGDQNAASNTTGTENSGGTNTGGSGGANAGGANSGGANTGGANTGGANTGGANTGGSNTGGANTGGGNTGTGGPCGGIAGVECGSAELCDYADDSCGGDDSAGNCVPKPDVCPDNIDPVCACDGKVYNNACEAAAAGVDLKLAGGCPEQAGQLPCGAEYCDKASEFCEVQGSDVGGEPDSYKCKTLPQNCTLAGATCDCLGDVPCHDQCELKDGGFTLTCPGG